MGCGVQTDVPAVAVCSAPGNAALVLLVLLSSGCRCPRINSSQRSSKKEPCVGSSPHTSWSSLIFSELTAEPLFSGQDSLPRQDPLIMHPKDGHRSLLTQAAYAGSSKTPALGRTEPNCVLRAAQPPSRATTALETKVSPTKASTMAPCEAAQTCCCYREWDSWPNPNQRFLRIISLPVYSFSSLYLLQSKPGTIRTTFQNPRGKGRKNFRLSLHMLQLI